MNLFRGICVGGKKAGEFFECRYPEFRCYVKPNSPEIFVASADIPEAAVPIETETYVYQQWDCAEEGRLGCWVLHGIKNPMREILEGYSKYQRLQNDPKIRKD